MNDNPVRRDDIMQRQVGQEHMLYDSSGGAVHVLNESAKFVWEHCDGSQSADEIAAAAVEEYGITEEQARSDIEQCLDTFRELSLLKA
jgi:PqqD family protein of HPr-rel-A system